MVDFCNKLSASENRTPCYYYIDTTLMCDFTKNGYRLPTEAEWEYAARGGKYTKYYIDSGSNKPDEVA